jgi:hypothetical protein
MITSYKLSKCDFNFNDFDKEEFEDTKELVRIRKSKDRQHLDQKKIYKWTNNYLQN